MRGFFYKYDSLLFESDKKERFNQMSTDLKEACKIDKQLERSSS